MKPKKTLHEHAIMVENLIFLAFVSLILSKYLAESALFWPLFLGGILLFVIAAVYYHKFCICPSCGHTLPITRHNVTNFCPNCGISLEETHE